MHPSRVCVFALQAPRATVGRGARIRICASCVGRPDLFLRQSYACTDRARYSCHLVLGGAQQGYRSTRASEPLRTAILLGSSTANHSNFALASHNVTKSGPPAFFSPDRFLKVWQVRILELLQLFPSPSAKRTIETSRSMTTSIDRILTPERVPTARLQGVMRHVQASATSLGPSAGPGKEASRSDSRKARGAGSPRQGESRRAVRETPQQGAPFRCGAMKGILHGLHRLSQKSGMCFSMPEEHGLSPNGNSDQDRRVPHAK